MANPKITITLDQSMLDAINSGVDALNRLADSLANYNSVKRGDGIITGRIKIPDAVKFDDLGSDDAQHEPVMPEPVQADTAPAAVPIVTSPALVQQPPFSMPTMQVAPATDVPSMPTPPVPTMPATAAAPVMPTTQPMTEYTMEQLGRAGAELMTRGVNVFAVLQEFGIMSLDALPKEQYGAFAQRLRQLGANI